VVSVQRTPLSLRDKMILLSTLSDMDGRFPAEARAWQRGQSLPSDTPVTADEDIDAVLLEEAITNLADLSTYSHSKFCFNRAMTHSVLLRKLAPVMHNMNGVILMHTLACAAGAEWDVDLALSKRKAGRATFQQALDDADVPVMRSPYQSSRDLSAI